MKISRKVATLFILSCLLLTYNFICSQTQTTTHTIEQPASPSAPTQPQQPAPPAGATLASMVLPFLIIFVAFYFLLIRPQKKQEQQRKKMLDSLQKNDYVLTSGGIYGTVVQVKDNEITLKIDDNVKVKMARNAVVGIITKAKNPEENK